LQKKVDVKLLKEVFELSYKRPLPFLPKFRVTGFRSGPKTRHAFTSVEAAKIFGGKFQEIFQWPVSLKEFDVELIIAIDCDVKIMMTLSGRQGMHHRNITNFGATTLRSTICHCLLRYFYSM